MHPGQIAAAQNVWEKWAMCLNFIHAGKVNSVLLFGTSTEAVESSVSLFKGSTNGFPSWCGTLNLTTVENWR